MEGGRGAVEVGRADYVVDPDWWLLMVREGERSER